MHRQCRRISLLALSSRSPCKLSRQQPSIGGLGENTFVADARLHLAIGVLRRDKHPKPAKEVCPPPPQSLPWRNSGGIAFSLWRSCSTSSTYILSSTCISFHRSSMACASTEWRRKKLLPSAWFSLLVRQLWGECAMAADALLQATVSAQTKRSNLSPIPTPMRPRPTRRSLSPTTRKHLVR